jgi:hypothetical protein
MKKKKRVTATGSPEFVPAKKASGQLPKKP